MTHSTLGATTPPATAAAVRALDFSNSALISAKTRLACGSRLKKAATYLIHSARARALGSDVAAKSTSLLEEVPPARCKVELESLMAVVHPAP